MRLETPTQLDGIYLARGEDEVDPGRPIFTGDVLRFNENPILVLQHPCAIRRGDQLAPHVLVAPCVRDSPPPSDWHGHFKKMLLPNLCRDDVPWSADFFNAHTVPGGQVQAATRIAQLSPIGVNLLMQRWVYHNTRVAIPTEAFHEAIAPQHAEVELQAEWVFQAEEKGRSQDEAITAFIEWLAEDDRRRAKSLNDPQKRACVRREAIAYWK